MTIDPSLIERANLLHFDSVVCDGHCDTLGDVLNGVRSLGERSTLGHIDLPRLKAGGVTAQIFACYVPIHEQRRGTATYALKLVDAFHESLTANPDDLLLATGAADIRRAKTGGKIAGILGLEGAESLEGSIELLRTFHRLGVRNIGLTWNFRNELADGVSEGGHARGLTPFGFQAIEACNELGIMIDIAHLAPAGVADVLAASKQPIIASHSNARALCDHIRNLTDAQIEAVAAGGGLIAATFVNAFLHTPWQDATIEHLLDHIDYLLKVAGPDHVMVGSDFDGATMPQGITDATDYPKLTAGMLARGHDELTIRQVLGENFLRVFEQVTGR